MSTLTNVDIAFIYGAELLGILLAARIGIWYGRRKPAAGSRVSRRARRDKVGELKARLSVAYGQQNAAMHRADRLDRDLAAEKRLHELTKDAAAAEKDTLWVNLNSRLEDIDQLRADLVDRDETIAGLSQDLNGVEQLKLQVAQALPDLSAEASLFLGAIREDGV